MIQIYSVWYSLIYEIIFQQFIVREGKLPNLDDSSWLRNLKQLEKVSWYLWNLARILKNSLLRGKETSLECIFL